ncbi:hypothetical protein D3C73_584150 [compost metagenome]
MIYLRERELWPLQLALREILISNSTDEMMSGTVAQDRAAIGETIKYATIMVATLPILAAYPFLQKYFVKGVMVGALKGKLDKYSNPNSKKPFSRLSREGLLLPGTCVKDDDSTTIQYIYSGRSPLFS